MTASPSDLLEGIRAKIDRAQEHSNELDGGIVAFLARHPYGIVLKRDLITGQCSLHLTVREQPPLRWSTLIGDWAYNLRSALDHLMWQLAGRYGVSQTDRLQFPIYGEGSRDGKKSAADLYGAWRKSALPAVLPAFEAVIETLQPYHRGAAYATDPVWILHRCCNIDKHQVLHTVGSVLVENAMGINVIDNYDVIDLSQFDVPSVVEGAEFSRFTLVQTGPNPQLQMYPRLAFDVHFADPGTVVSGQPVRSTLQVVTNFVISDILPQFEPLLI